jgi:hypothetical protein
MRGANKPPTYLARKTNCFEKLGAFSLTPRFSFSGVLGRAWILRNRFNGFVVTPLQPVQLHQHLKLLNKTPLPVVCFLIGDVLGNLSYTNPVVRPACGL